MRENREKTYPHKRVQGDNVWYFFSHNTISLLLFFLICLQLDLFVRQTDSIMGIVSMEFLQLILQVFLISLLCGIIGRIFGFMILKLILRGKPMRKFVELNSGINKISFSYLLSLLINAVFFSIGALFILQETIFNEDTLLTLIATYIIIKIVVYFITRMFTTMKF